MKKFISSLAVALLVAATGISSPNAQDLSPVGTWRLDAGQSHYEVSFCGENVLCAKVIWLGPETLDEKTGPYLGKYLVEAAHQTGPHTWKGEVSVFGDKLNGTVEQVSADELKLTGCKFIFCKSFKMFRL